MHLSTTCSGATVYKYTVVSNHSMIWGHPNLRNHPMLTFCNELNRISNRWHCRLSSAVLKGLNGRTVQLTCSSHFTLRNPTPNLFSKKRLASCSACTKAQSRKSDSLHLAFIKYDTWSKPLPCPLGPFLIVDMFLAFPAREELFVGSNGRSMACQCQDRT